LDDDVGFPCSILVVDDDPANVLAIQVALGDLGERALGANSGAKALQFLLEHDFAVV
jgi:CheY-like chemotaxis protein